MGQTIEFRNYLASGGRNPVKEWFDSIPVEAKQKLNAALLILENPANWREAEEIKKLKGVKGLWELRVKHANVLYRPILCKGPGTGEWTLLLGAFETGDRFNPPNATKTSANRKREVETGKKDTTPHDYS